MEILVISGQKAEAESVARRISVIRGVEETAPVVDITQLKRVDEAADILGGLIRKPGQKSKTVWVDIVVDEKGNVLDAKPEPTNDINVDGKKVIELAHREVKSWKFRPLVLEGVRKKMYGRVSYRYFVKA